MPRYFVNFTYLFFILVAASGIWMRVFSLHPFTTIPYTNVLHAHSHLAFLGWAFLGIFIIFIKIYWDCIAQKKQAIAMIITLFVTTMIMFFAYIYEGYGPFSIAMATAHIFVEYWVAIFMYRQMKNDPNISKIGFLFIKASLVALVISSISPFSLGFIAANGLKDTYVFDMAIYFYLHFQYNGWQLLALIGLFILILHKKKITMNESLLKAGFWIYFVSLFPGYFHSILWADLGSVVEVLATIGSIGQWIAVICIIISCKKTIKQIDLHFHRLTTVAIWLIGLLLFFKSTMELGLVFPGLAHLVYDTRSVIIGYLHFTLLGFVSLFIITQFLMVSIMKVNRIVVVGSLIFLSGFLLNELLLFTQGLTEWVDMASVPYLLEGLLIASILLLIGVITLWFSFIREKSA